VVPDDHQPVAEDHLELRIGLGHAGDQTLTLRVSPSAATQLREMMAAGGVFAGEILEFSSGPELIIYAGSFAGGLTGLAAVLRAFFHRNQYKSITFSQGDGSVDLKGYSESQANRLIDATLKQMHAKQMERDEQWQRILGHAGESD
jgi:hypothetical protein